jgi:NAD-dependent deacetylase
MPVNTGAIAVLTGAGISAESGIPTFRGADGFWTVGSRHYHPQEIATRRAFAAMPREVWSWYLSRRHACRDARPNAGHEALAQLSSASGPGKSVLITQNVDGLHAESGVHPDSLFEIHGNIHWMRCFADCSDSLQPLPETLEIESDSEQTIAGPDWEKLHCARCGGLMRPHVLWFDEYYEERFYRSDSALQALANSNRLIVVGTSGSTTLPAMVVQHALAAGMEIIEVNVERSAFTACIEASPVGRFVKASASTALPGLVEELLST